MSSPEIRQVDVHPVGKQSSDLVRSPGTQQVSSSSPGSPGSTYGLPTGLPRKQNCKQTNQHQPAQSLISSVEHQNQSNSDGYESKLPRMGWFMRKMTKICGRALHFVHVEPFKLSPVTYLFQLQGSAHV